MQTNFLGMNWTLKWCIMYYDGIEKYDISALRAFRKKIHSPKWSWHFEGEVDRLLFEEECLYTRKINKTRFIKDFSAALDAMFSDNRFHLKVATIKCNFATNNKKYFWIKLKLSYKKTKYSLSQGEFCWLNLKQSYSLGSLSQVERFRSFCRKSLELPTFTK